MNRKKTFLELLQSLNPIHKFTTEEQQFLLNEYEELKAFVEGLSQSDKQRITEPFCEILNDEIFYYDKKTWVKFDEKKARKFKGQTIISIPSKTLVDVYRSI